MNKTLGWKIVFGITFGWWLCAGMMAQTTDSITYWNAHTQLTPWRMPITNAPVEYIDLDRDGDPDILITRIFGDIPVMWIDDNDNMQYGDTEGDMIDDCLLIDLNRDGVFGGPMDLCIDWVDENNDGIVDVQVVVSNGKGEKFGYFDWGADFMYIIDFNEKDGIHNYIDWNQIRLMCWAHSGHCNFFTDYHGNTLFLKMHASTFNIADLRYNWENPFIFFDQDGDGLSEFSIRMVDTPYFRPKEGNSPHFKDIDERYEIQFTQKIDWAALSWDLDNDNCPGNEFDFDMSLHFRGEGFDYSDQVHTFKKLRGLPEADKLIYDPRWRQQTELIYPDPKKALELLFKRGKGKYDQCWFVFDEDDDCNRWERVEFYEPKDLYAIGLHKGGLDNNAQSDAIGDRGEWDLDNSGEGSLYVGTFDGRIHLYGAEWGCWRIDQTAYNFQGFGGLYDKWNYFRMNPDPEKFGLVKYTDTDNNGFIDLIEYDLDGDRHFEERISLLELGIDDRNTIIDTSKQSYDDMHRLFKTVSDNMWKQAEEVVEIAKKQRFNVEWYNFYRHPRSVKERYQYGYWLAFYLYHDMKQVALQKGDKELAQKIDKAYYSKNWNSF